MTAFGFDPEQIFRRRPRVLRERRPPSRRRRIGIALTVALVVLVLASTSLLRLRVNYLFLSNLGHANVFWTPLVTQFWLFLVGFAITGGIVGISVPLWSRAVSCIDARAGRVTWWAGIAVTVIAGITGGVALAGSW